MQHLHHAEECTFSSSVAPPQPHRSLCSSSLWTVRSSGPRAAQRNKTCISGNPLSYTYSTIKCFQSIPLSHGNNPDQNQHLYLFHVISKSIQIDFTTPPWPVQSQITREEVCWVAMQPKKLQWRTPPDTTCGIKVDPNLDVIERFFVNVS